MTLREKLDKLLDKEKLGKLFRLIYKIFAILVLIAVGYVVIFTAYALIMDHFFGYHY